MSGSEGSVVETSPGLVRAPVEADAPVEALVEGFSSAGFDLMRAQPVDENLVVSPLSRPCLVGRAAADETTGAAIDNAFGLPAGMAAHDGWNALDAALAASNGTEIALNGSTAGCRRRPTS